METGVAARYGDAEGDAVPMQFQDQRPVRRPEVAIHSASRGVGFYRLHVQLDLDLCPAESEATALTVSIDRGAVGAAGTVGPGGASHRPPGQLHLQSGGPVRQRVGSTDLPDSWQFILELSGERVAALERLRAVGDLRFEFLFRGTMRRGALVESGDLRLGCTVPQSEWCGFLRRMGYQDTLLLEVPVVPMEVDERLAKAAARLREARSMFTEGRYAKVVQECRHVMEALGHEEGDGHRPKNNGKKPSEFDKDERLMEIRSAIFSMSCLAAHSSDEVSLATSWDRHDALGLLSMTAAAVAWVADSRDA